MNSKPRQALTRPLKNRLYRIVRPLVSRALGQHTLETVFDSARTHHSQRADRGTLFAWMDSLLTTMQQEYRVEAAPGFELPQTGPLIIVSNRPFGLLDPVVLAHFLCKQRTDVRLLGEAILAFAPELEPHVIAVDASDTDSAPMTKALEHLNAGGVLVVFPSSKVAHYQPGRGVVESPWTSHVGALVRNSGAPVLPVFFAGRNSTLFQASGMLHESLRERLIVREFVKRRRRPVLMRVGQMIGPARLKKFEDDASLTSFLRLQTLVLGVRKAAAVRETQAENLGRVAGAIAPVLLQQDVKRLRDAGRCLATQGSLSVYVATAMEIPHVLHEIGRQREITFRAVGEGTGGEIDLDRFDNYYLHIFLWDDAQQQLAGAYRLGCANEILKTHGRHGLYTSTLFKFKRKFLHSLHDAVEMGRSFVAAAYQRNATALPLLWKGVIVWLGRNPHYRKLFGPVSISQDYDKASKQLIVQYLSQHHGDAALTPQVKPRKPFRCFGMGNLVKEFVSSQLADAEDCSAVISSLESDGKGLPVLLKHYLRLNGKMLSFNVDREFSNVLDGLVMVDMLQTDPRLPSKFMGRELWSAYQRYHGRTVE